MAWRTIQDFSSKDMIDRYVSAHLERRANLGYHLWGLMILFLVDEEMADSNGTNFGAPSKATETVLTST